MTPTLSLGQPQLLESCYKKNESGGHGCNLVQAVGWDGQRRFRYSVLVYCLLAWQNHWRGEWQSFIWGVHVLLLMKK
jgi:hypothetical protein